LRGQREARQAAEDLKLLKAFAMELKGLTADSLERALCG
jgi:hypothetical protein